MGKGKRQLVKSLKPKRSKSEGLLRPSTSSGIKYDQYEKDFQNNLLHPHNLRHRCGCLSYWFYFTGKILV